MHRAEKASSKICREREVEKAQELHRRKIDGVKSYVSAITRPPGTKSLAPTASTTFFRRKLRQHPTYNASAASLSTSSASLSSSIQLSPYPPPNLSITSASSTNVQQQQHPHSFASDTGDTSCASDEGGGDDASDGSGDESELYGASDNDDGEPDADAPQQLASKTFDKLDEFRSVLVPVMAYNDDDVELGFEASARGGTTRHHGHKRQLQQPHAASISSTSTTATTARNAFRLRRLKQIETDNATLFARIKQSTAHYRTQHFEKDWDQNVAYLTSICEFPVLDATLHAAPGQAIRRAHLASRKHTPLGRAELPSLAHPPVVHPIKAIPTSPRKAPQLNLSPAFRSLRKGLPQVPSLPPLASASSRATVIAASVATASTTAATTDTTTRTSSKAELNGTDVSQTDDTTSAQECETIEDEFTSTSDPYRRHRTAQAAVHTKVEETASAATLAARSEAAYLPAASRYRLLKVGRFVGGKYLVLTVFCGDGITNPYGFDVVARDRATRVAYRLSVTKETTHALLDAISSASLAKATAAAAGTNLSMERIARSICDRIGFARLDGAHSGELLFLVATAETEAKDSELHVDTQQPNGELVSSALTPATTNEVVIAAREGPCLLLDTKHGALALCVHHIVLVPDTEEADPVDDGRSRSKRMHVYVSTRPLKSCRASMSATPSTRAEATATTGSTAVPGVQGEHSGLVVFSLSDDEVGDDDGKQSVSMGDIAKRRGIELETDREQLLRELEQHGVVRELCLRWSLERLLVIAIRYLHTGQNKTTLRFDASRRNSWILELAETPAASSPRATADVAWKRTQVCLPPIHSAIDDVDVEGSGAPLPATATGDSPVAATAAWTMILQTGLVWKGAYLFARVALRRPLLDGDNSAAADAEEIVVNVFNPSSGRYAERVLDGDRAEGLSRRLGAWQRANEPALVGFARHLLAHAQLELDVRGQEVIVFASLEPRHSITQGERSPSAFTRSAMQHSPRRDRLGPPHNCHHRDPDHQHAPHHAVSHGANDAPQRSSSLEEELQAQASAAIKIQARGRGFLCRKHSNSNGMRANEEVTPPILQPVPVEVSSTKGHVTESSDRSHGHHHQHHYSAFLESLAPAPRSMVLHRAARRIQAACVEYLDARAARRNARATIGVDAIKPQRLVTPTLKLVGGAAQHRLSRTGHDAEANELHGADAQAKERDGEDEDEEDDDYDSDDHGVGHAVALLGVVQEDEQAELDASRMTVCAPVHPAQLQALQALASAHEEVEGNDEYTDSPPSPTQAREPSYRAGKKVHNRFVLQRHALDPDIADGLLESRVIAQLGQLDAT